MSYVMYFLQFRNIVSMYDMSWLGDDALYYVMYVALYNLCHSVGQECVYDFTQSYMMST